MRETVRRVGQRFLVGFEGHTNVLAAGPAGSFCFSQIGRKAP